MSIWRGQPSPDFEVAPSASLGSAISWSAAYAFASETEIFRYHAEPRQRHRYGRDSSTTASFVEQWLSNLYPDKAALVFPSGMASIAACLQLAEEGSRHIFLTKENYRKTLGLAQREATHLTNINGAAHLREELSRCDCKQKILLVESPANPHLRIVNLPALAEIGKEYGALCAWDATFAGLDNLSACYASYDIVVHSATKYISGHDDVIAGVLFASPELLGPLLDIRSQSSSVLDPTSAALLARSLFTYDVRLERMLQNTRHVLEFLSAKMSSGTVQQIWYPGEFANSDQYQVAHETMSHGGCVVSFDLAEGLANGFTDARSCSALRLAPSFGSVTTLFEKPASMSHGAKPLAEVEALGIERNLVRLSVGCEPIETILHDMEMLLI